MIRSVKSRLVYTKLLLKGTFTTLIYNWLQLHTHVENKMKLNGKTKDKKNEELADLVCITILYCCLIIIIKNCVFVQ